MVQMGLEVRNEVERRVWEPKKSNLNIGKVRRGLRIEWRRISHVTRKKMGRTEEWLRVWLEHWWRRGTEGGAGGSRRHHKGQEHQATPARGGREMDQPGGTFPRGLIRYPISGAHRQMCGLLRAEFKIKKCGACYLLLLQRCSKIIPDSSGLRRRTKIFPHAGAPFLEERRLPLEEYMC